MRRILIPTDFSENAINAINYAVQLFKYDHCEFYLMHAYQDDIYKKESSVTRENRNEITLKVADQANKHLESLLKKVKNSSPNPHHNYRSIAVNNILIDAADTLVDEKNIDLIIMGTRGNTNDRKITFGSQTMQVLKYVQCPVLAIPDKKTYEPPKQILFPTNYLIPFKPRELELLCDIMAPYQSVLEVVHISQSKNLSMRQEDNQLFMKEALCKNEIHLKTLNSKNMVEAVHQYINDNPIDMLVMVNSRHSFLESILYPTQVDQLTLELNIPFLAMQNIKRNA